MACFFISRVRLVFCLFGLLSPFSLPLVVPSLDVFSLAGSFRYFFYSFGFSSRFMLLGFVFAWVLFFVSC